MKARFLLIVALVVIALTASAQTGPTSPLYLTGTGSVRGSASTGILSPNVLYDDGPTNGTCCALFIDGPNPGFVRQSISDQFIATNSGTASALDFGIWVPSGDRPMAVSWWLGTTAFAGDISSGSVRQVAYTDFLSNNRFGYDVYVADLTGLSGNLVAGNTYYLTLGNAIDSNYNQAVEWDINQGPAVCYFMVAGVNHGDCNYDHGEAFTLYGSVPEPSSAIMFGSGVLGLAGLFRRKINL